MVEGWMEGKAIDSSENCRKNNFSRHLEGTSSYRSQRYK